MRFGAILQRSPVQTMKPSDSRASTAMLTSAVNDKNLSPVNLLQKDEQFWELAAKHLRE